MMAWARLCTRCAAAAVGVNNKDGDDDDDVVVVLGGVVILVDATKGTDEAAKKVAYRVLKETELKELCEEANANAAKKD